jgi:hypothetical protein
VHLVYTCAKARHPNGNPGEINVTPEPADGGRSPALTEDVNRPALSIFLGLCLSIAVGLIANTFSGMLIAQLLPGTGANPAFVATSLSIMGVLLVVLGLSVFRPPHHHAQQRLAALMDQTDALKELPHPVIEQLTTLTKDAEQHCARRSYVLFAWGMVLGYFLLVIPSLLRG